jgi:hypothetical protein
MSDINDLMESLGAAPAPVAEFIPVSPSTGSTGQTTGVEERALKLLGSGIQAEQVAAALGVTPSRVAQLLGQEAFASKVAALRYENLQSANKRDGEYDDIEDDLLARLKRSMPLMIKPDTILKAIQVVNGAKRRGQSAPAQVTNQQNVVTIVLPSVIASKFAVDINNQVIKAGDQTLLTMPSGNLLKQVEEAEAVRIQDNS